MFKWGYFITKNLHNPKLLHPGLRSRSYNVRQNPLKVFHWNPNSRIPAHNGIRIWSIEAINQIYNYDVITIIESALHESVSDDDIHLKGFLSIRRDIPEDTIHDGILLYYRDNLAIREREELQTQLLKIIQFTI